MMSEEKKLECPKCKSRSLVLMSGIVHIVFVDEEHFTEHKYDKTLWKCNDCDAIFEAYYKA